MLISDHVLVIDYIWSVLLIKWVLAWEKQLMCEFSFGHHGEQFCDYQILMISVT